MGADLRSRVVATRDQPAGVEKPKTLAEQIEAKKDVFQAALPEGAEARHLIRDAISLLRQNPNLAKCEVNTVLGGLMTFAQLGLRPGVLGHGWLIPFKKRVKVGNQWTDQWEAQVVIGYKGYAELIHRSGAATTMVARPVHENDVFELAYGIEDRLVHKPEMNGPRGEVTGYYSVIKFKNGGYVFWYMSKTECEEHRDNNAMAKKAIYENGQKVGEEVVGPWKDNFDQMAQKTVFLRAQNLAPKTTMLSLATAVDGAVRRDMGDADEMFFAQHPEGAEVIDGEIEGDPVDEPAPTPEGAPAQEKAA
jgi:recombination protein RecT